MYNYITRICIIMFQLYSFKITQVLIDTHNVVSLKPVFEFFTLLNEYEFVFIAICWML